MAFEQLTKYIPIFEEGKIGYWPPQQKDENGSLLQVLPRYSLEVRNFKREVMLNYFDIENERENCLAALKRLDKEDKNWTYDTVDVSDKDAYVVIGLIMRLIHHERYFDGLFFSYAENGTVLRWLRRLKEIDEGGHENE